MANIKSLKGVTRRKNGIVELGDGVVLPIRTLSIAEEVIGNFNEYYEIPKRNRRATQEEIEDIKKMDPTFNTKTIPMITDYDVASAAYQEALLEKEKLEEMLSVIKYIDMDYKLENGNTLWEDLGIKRGDWFRLAKIFAYDLCLTAKDLELITIEVKKLRGESVFEKLAKFEKATNVSTPEILSLVYNKDEIKDKMMQAVSLIEDRELQIQELESKLEELEKELSANKDAE
jgi:hypothetical protein